MASEVDGESGNVTGWMDRACVDGVGGEARRLRRA